MDSTIVGAIIGVGGTIVGSIIGFFITNISTKKQFELENSTKILKQIIIDIINKAEICFLTETTYRNEHDLKKKFTIDEFNKYMCTVLKDNSSILDNDLHLLSTKLILTDFEEDFTGFIVSYKSLEYTGELIDYLLKKNKKYKIYNKKTINRYRKLKTKLQLWSLLVNKYMDPKEVNNLLGKSWAFTKPLHEIYFDPTFKKFLNDFDEIEDFASQITNYYWIKNKSNTNI